MDSRLPVALYRRLLGPAYDRLPGIIQAMHDVDGVRRATGRGRVRRGGPAARLVASLLGMPPAAEDLPVEVVFTSAGGVETLARHYGGAVLTTRQEEGKGRHRGRLRESFGPVALFIRLEGSAEGITFHLADCALWRLPLPPWLSPKLEARERVTGGRYHYFVHIRMPLIGTLIEYEGLLSIDRGDGDDG